MRKGIAATISLHKSGYQKALKMSVEKLRFYVDKQIAASFQNIEADFKAREGDLDSMQSHVFVEQLAYETQDRDFIRDQLLNIFFPARDASSAGASFIFFILARRPDVWKKLRDEVSSLEEPLTSRNLNSLHYLNSVINECE